MKTIIILVLVAAAQAAVLDVEPARKTFLRPTRIIELEAFTPDRITLRWIPVKISKEPTVGYKVKLRMFEGPKVTKYISANGTEVEDIQVPTLSDISLDSPHKLYEYMITGVNNTRLTINGVKRETPYMLNVLPYSEQGDGPLSPPLSIQIRSDDQVSFSTQTNVVLINRLG
ncbi:uncharacterized protein [Epargyreus clarus]